MALEIKRTSITRLKHVGIKLSSGFSSTLSQEPGGTYIIGFLYVTGDPAATGFDLVWSAVRGDGSSSSETPMDNVITPARPETTGGAGRFRSGTVRGTLPLIRDITYTGTVWIRQA